MGKSYSQELDAFSATYAWAGQQDIRGVGHFLARWGGEHVAVVGSGGSYSAARVAALFRELAHHAVTTTHTPLEFISLASRLSPRVLFLSAEGKNKDILAGLTAAAEADLAACAMTLTKANPVTEVAEAKGTPRVFSFEMDWAKDGYLATNSLLATILLFYRIYFGDEEFERSLGPFFFEGRLRKRRAAMQELRGAIQPGSRTLLILHSAETAPFAVDLGLRLTESALMSVQVTDLRQFAHGQHLQLASPATAPLVLIAYSRTERMLARGTADQFPAHVVRTYLEIEGATSQDIAVAGLIDAMFFAEAVASHASYDIGNPDVPSFGRAIHQLDPNALRGREAETTLFLDRAAHRKQRAGRSLSRQATTRIQQAAGSYLKKITSASIRAVVCDFDGTLCRAEDRFDPMGSTLATLLSNLIRGGLKVAIASGRGGSLRDSLAPSLDPELLSDITVGYYSGAVISTLDQVINPPAASPGFDELAHWLEGTTYSGLINGQCSSARLGQFTILVNGPGQSARLLAAVRGWLRRTGRGSWRAYASGHSVDILDDQTSKCLVVDHLASAFGFDPLTEILRIGDCGHEDGNDYELLSEGLSLSCDSVSSDLNTCWNFGPKGNNQAETTITYLRSLIPSAGAYRLSDALLAHD